MPLAGPHLMFHGKGGMFGTFGRIPGVCLHNIILSVICVITTVPTHSRTLAAFRCCHESDEICCSLTNKVIDVETVRCRDPGHSHRPIWRRRLRIVLRASCLLQVFNQQCLWLVNKLLEHP